MYIGPKTMMAHSRIIATGAESIIHIDGGCTNIKNSSFIASQCSGKIFIGNGFTSEGSHIKAHEGKKVSIGKDCMFSAGIDISTTDYHSVLSVVDGTRINGAKDIIIGNHVWLGRNVDVLKGATIADDIVVGMGSTVSKPLVQSYTVYAGIPAKQVKRGTTWVRKMI